MEGRSGPESFLSSPLFALFIWLLWGAFLLLINFFLRQFKVGISSSALILIFMFLFYAAGLFLAWFFGAHKKDGWSAVGLSGFDISALVWGAAAFFLFFLFTNLYGYIVSFFGFDINKAYDFSFFFTEARGWLLLPTFFVVGFLGPLAEEFFFRGYFYLYLKKRQGILVALLISSLLFSLLHLSALFFIPFLFFGILSTLMLEKRGSLDASLVFHILNNVLALLFFLLFKV